MQKTIVLCLALVLCAGIASADRSTYDETLTQQALLMPAPPTIDGVIDSAAGEWTYASGASQGGTASHWRITINDYLEDFVQGGTLGDVTEPPWDNEDLSFQVYAGYDADNLYVAVDVSDYDMLDDSAAANSENGNTWEDDSVEVFIDGDNSNFDTRDTTGTNPEVSGAGGQFVITINNAYRDAEAGNPGYGENAAWYAKTAWTDTGYQAEFRISLSTIGNPQPGDIIGFNVAVNDDDDGGGNEYQIVWEGLPHVENTYGNLLIGSRSYTAPKAAAPTVDGVVNAGEYDGAEEIQFNTFTAIYDTEAGDNDFTIGDHDLSAWVVHDDNAVYIGVIVTDDNVVTDTAAAGTDGGNTWEDDSVEVFFDVDDSNDSGRGVLQFEGQYVITANGATRDVEANDPIFGEADDWFGAASTTDTGYQVEFKITKFALMDVTDGTTMGFTLGLNDDGEAVRRSQCGTAALTTNLATAALPCRAAERTWTTGLSTNLPRIGN